MIEEVDCSGRLPAFEGAYKVTKARRWTDGETKRFYEALSRVGEDLTMIAAMLPNVDYKDVVRKYRRERRTNPSAIEAALKNGKPMLSVKEYEDDRGTKLDVDTIHRNRALLTAASTGEDIPITLDADLAIYNDIWRGTTTAAQGGDIEPPVDDLEALMIGGADGGLDTAVATDSAAPPSSYKTNIFDDLFA